MFGGHFQGRRLGETPGIDRGSGSVEVLVKKQKVLDPLTPIGFANRLFYHTQRLCFDLILKVLCRFKVTGTPPVGEGGLIIASNHNSLIDPVVLQVAVRRRMHYLMTSDYYFVPLLNLYSRIMRCIPVMEERFNREALREAMRVLDHGRTIGIFPQGGLMPEGDFSGGMRGISLLISQSKVPVLPVRISGTAGAFPKGARMIRPKPISVSIGKPVLPDDLTRPDDFPNRREYMDALTIAVMKAIETA